MSELTEEQIERKRALGIPVHLKESDCEYRRDGFCNCGKREPGTADPWARRTPSAHRTTGKINLDIQERNGTNGDRG